MFHLYGLIVGVAIATGWYVAEKIEPKVGKVAPWVIVGGIVGARIYHVIDYLSYYQANPWQVVALWNGGLGIWGGIIGGIVGLWIASSRAKSRDLKVKDSSTHSAGSVQAPVGMTSVLGAIAVAMPLSQAIGRVANGVNGEFTNKVIGLPWWSVEAVANLSLFGVMWTALLGGRTSRSLVGMYLIGYGVIRFSLEILRDRSWELGSIPVASIFSVISVIIGAWLMRRAQD